MQIAPFTEKVAEILRRHFPGKDFTIRPEEGLLLYGDLQCGMDNLHRQYMQRGVDEETFEQIVIEKIGNILFLSQQDDLIPPQDWEQAAPRLRLQLFHRRIAQEGLLLQFPFSSSVYFSIVIDSPKGYAYVSPDLAKKWEQSPIDLMEIAQQNLLRASENMQMMSAGGEVPILMIQTSDGYDAARILVPEIRASIIKTLTGTEHGHVFVGVPNRDFLIAWAPSIADSMHDTLCAQIAEDAASQPYPLCEKPMRITKDTIDPTL